MNFIFFSKSNISALFSFLCDKLMIFISLMLVSLDFYYYSKTLKEVETHIAEMLVFTLE